MLKHEPSAQSPWQNTMPGFESLDIAHLSDKGYVWLLRITKRLPIDERRKQLAKTILHLAWLAESAVEKRLESLLRFRPRQRGRKGVEGVEEAVDRWQRDLVNEILRCRDRAPIEGGNPAREHVHEAVQLRVRKSPINVSVPFSGLAVKVVRPENDFERATAAEE